MKLVPTNRNASTCTVGIFPYRFRSQGISIVGRNLNSRRIVMGFSLLASSRTLSGWEHGVISDRAVLSDSTRPRSVRRY